MLKCFNFVTFKELKEVLMFLKIADQAFEAGDFLNIFLRFWAFWGSFSYKNVSYENNVHSSGFFQFWTINAYETVGTCQTVCLALQRYTSNVFYNV